MIVGNPIMMGGSGSGASGYTYDDGILHIWGVRGSHLIDTKTIVEGGVYKAADDGLEGYSIVNVDYEQKLEKLTATLNGHYLPSAGKNGFSEVTVANPSDGRCQSSPATGWCSMADLLSFVSWKNFVG